MSVTSAELIAALHHFGLERERLRTALARRLGLGTTDLDALEHLERDGPMTQRRLGERLLLTSGAVTMLVDRLERSGLVRRDPHPTDRRAVLLALDGDAQRAAPEALRAYHEALLEAAEAIPQRHRAAVRAFLQRAAAQAASATSSLTSEA